MAEHDLMTVEEPYQIGRLDAFINYILGKTAIQYALLAAITLVALIMRFYKLGAWSFWIDEAFTVSAAEFISEWPIARLPIYLVLIRGALDLFGTNEWSARFVPAVIGVITIPALFFPVRKIFGPLVALIAVLILALSPWHLYWSQNARFYSLLLLLYNLGMFLILLGIKREKPAYFLISALFLFLAIREKATGFFFVPVILTYLFVTTVWPFDGSRVFRFRYIALVGLPIIFYSFYDISRVMIWRQPSMISGFIETFVGATNINPLRLFFALVYKIGIPLIVLGIMGGVYLITQKRRDGLLVFFGATVPPISLLVLSIFMFTTDRYVFITLPFWAVLSAVAIMAAYKPGQKLGILLPSGLLAIVIITFSSQGVLYYQYQNGDRSDWRSAFEFVSQRKDSGDLVTTTWPEMAKYYLGEKAQYINEYTPDEIMNSQNRVWFVIDEESGYVEPSLHTWIMDKSSLIEIIEVQIPGKSLNIRIYRYDPVLAGFNPAILEVQQESLV